MAFEAKIIVALDEEIAIDRSVRVVAGDAAFAQRFMLKDKRAALLAMAGRAAFIQARHRQARVGLHDFTAMRVMALYAVHSAFNHGMMLRQGEIGVNIEMALEAGGRVFTGIDDEHSAPPAGRDVLAAGAVAGFATGQGGEFDIIFIKFAVDAGSKSSGDIRMAFNASGIPHEMRAFDLRRLLRSSFERSAGGEQAGGECYHGKAPKSHHQMAGVFTVGQKRPATINDSIDTQGLALVRCVRESEGSQNNFIFVTTVKRGCPITNAARSYARRYAR